MVRPDHPSALADPSLDRPSPEDPDGVDDADSSYLVDLDYVETSYDVDDWAEACPEASFHVGDEVASCCHPWDRSYEEALPLDHRCLACEVASFLADVVLEETDPLVDQLDVPVDQEVLLDNAVTSFHYQPVVVD